MSCIITFTSYSNQILFSLVNIFFVSLYYSIHTVLNACEPFSSSFSCHIKSILAVRLCASSSISLFYSRYFWVPSLSSLRKIQSILQKRQPRYLYLWLNFYTRVLFREVFLFFWDTFFSLFLSSPFALFSASNIPRYKYCSFSPGVLIFFLEEGQFYSFSCFFFYKKDGAYFNPKFQFLYLYFRFCQFV